MPRYADGFVITVPKRKLDAYRRISQKAGRVWKEYGAIEYIECVGDDLAIPAGLPFPRLTKARPGEAVVFSWILYKSRRHRDHVNKKVMADTRIKMDEKSMPFDMKRMSCGGFETLVDLA